MAPSSFVSYAQNAEDVVLWRALREVEHGVYVDVGANHPSNDSVTKAFYDRGWRGLDVEPVAEFAQALREARSRDVVAEVAVSTDDGGEAVLHEFRGTGLSTMRSEYVREQVERGYELRETRVPVRSLQSLVEEHLRDAPVHFCKIDVEGAEKEVLASVDLTTWRPWVLVVEATRPNSTEPTHAEWEPDVLAAGYQFCLFDGLSRYYVCDEQADRLQPRLSYPACSLDDFHSVQVDRAEAALAELAGTHHETVQELGRSHSKLLPLEAEVTAVRSELVHWRGVVLERWAAAVASRNSVQDDSARAELDALRRTVSWRVTRPLRAVRSAQRRLAP